MNIHDEILSILADYKNEEAEKGTDVNSGIETKKYALHVSAKLAILDSNADVAIPFGA